MSRVRSLRRAALSVAQNTSPTPVFDGSLERDHGIVGQMGWTNSIDCETEGTKFESGLRMLTVAL